MTKVQAEALKAQVALAFVQLTMLCVQATITGANVKDEGREIGDNLRNYIDAMVNEE